MTLNTNGPKGPGFAGLLQLKSKTQAASRLFVATASWRWSRPGPSHWWWPGRGDHRSFWSAVPDHSPHDDPADRRTAHGHHPARSRGRPSRDMICPDVDMVVILHLGSSPTDPLNPGQFPIALLLSIGRPIQQQFGPDRVRVCTVPPPRSSTIRSRPAKSDVPQRLPQGGHRGGRGV